MQSSIRIWVSCPCAWAQGPDPIPTSSGPEQRQYRARFNRWSVAECVVHLNLTTNAFLPPLRQALQQCRTLGISQVKRYRCDPLGWLLRISLPPPVRFRSRTSAAFLPEAGTSVDDIVETFRRLQDTLLELLRESDSLPLNRVKLRSPFNNRISYNVYSCYGIIAAHQHRHLWQAEQLMPKLASTQNNYDTAAS